MSKEILMVVDVVSAEKGVEKDIIFEAIEAALAQAAKKRSTDEIEAVRKIDRIFEPNISADEAESRFAMWQKAVDRCKNWELNE